MIRAFKPCLALLAAVLALAAPAARAKDRPSQQPLLVIGASYSEGKTPFNGASAPLGGVSVGFGSYLSLGQALTRSELLPGYVINEAQAGATTFSRAACTPGAAACGPAAWDGYAAQLDKALARVALPPSFDTYNARYVVITVPNDCLHADAFGVPQAGTRPCTPAQLNAVVDRQVALGRHAIEKGLVPVFDVYPRHEQLDLERFRGLFGLAWVIDPASYDLLRELSRARLRAELPQALVLDIWRDFHHIGDGLHPDADTARRAARLIAIELLRRDTIKP
jgi:hypothetical protein